MATAIIGTLKHLPKASILPTLPETGRPNRIYFIPNEDPTEANAITISAYGASLVAVNSRRGSSIVHEAEHIKNHIWQYIGYTPQRDNDEVDAYLLTYIYDKITQVFYKHKDNKE